MACGDTNAHLVDAVDANIPGADTLHGAGSHDSSDVIDNDGDCSGNDSDSWELDLPQYLPGITADVRFTQRMQAYSRILGIPLPYAGSQPTETVPHPQDDDQVHNCNTDDCPSDENQTGHVTENDDNDVDNLSEESESGSETSENSENEFDDQHIMNGDENNMNAADEAHHDGNDDDDDDGYEHSLNLSDISTTPSMGSVFCVDSETESSVGCCSSQCKRRRL